MERYDIGTTTFGYSTKDERDMRHYMERQDRNKHPKATHQGYDFFMNLGIYQ